MLQSAVWNILVHGGRGYIYWTANFRDSSSGGDPDAEPYPGATYQGAYALYGEHEWDAQYAAAQAVNREVKSLATESELADGHRHREQLLGRRPVATLGKDAGGRLWLLAQADGNTAAPVVELDADDGHDHVAAGGPPGDSDRRRGRASARWSSMRSIRSRTRSRRRPRRRSAANRSPTAISTTSTSRAEPAGGRSRSPGQVALTPSARP